MCALEVRRVCGAANAWRGVMRAAKAAGRRMPTTGKVRATAVTATAVTATAVSAAGLPTATADVTAPEAMLCVAQNRGACHCDAEQDGSKGPDCLSRLCCVHVRYLHFAPAGLDAPPAPLFKLTYIKTRSPAVTLTYPLYAGTRGVFKGVIGVLWVRLSLRFRSDSVHQVNRDRRRYARGDVAAARDNPHPRNHPGATAPAVLHRRRKAQ